jgi:hypothetical protein
LLFLNLGAIPRKKDTELVFCFEGSIGTFTDPEQLFVESPGLEEGPRPILSRFLKRVLELLIFLRKHLIKDRLRGRPGLSTICRAICESAKALESILFVI